MNNRLQKIDIVRGITLISMILYHFVWDLKYIACFDIGWYSGLYGRIWQRSICISFIFLSGFCFSLGKKQIKRGLEIFICGLIITGVTLLFMPENRIVFGILTFMGTAGLIAVVIDKIIHYLYKSLDPHTLNLTLLIGNILLFIAFYDVNYGELNIFVKRISLPSYLYDGYFATFLGFPDRTFFSTDYFALLPWMFLYLIGYFTYKLLSFEKKDGNSIFVDRLSGKVTEILRLKNENTITRSLGIIGRNTLIIYMIHQPILYGITILIQRL